MEEKSQNRERARTLLCAFFLPCVLLLTVFAATGIHPFGEKSLLIIDMNNEYVDYLAQMNESVRSGGSLLRSWNMGMGLNMLGLIAFYTASPFNLLVLLFPVAYLTEVILAITVLKIGLAGLLFALYADYALGRRGLLGVAFAVAYALCGYNIAYASNIMWLDGTAFLPLVLLGVERLLREEWWGLLTFGYAYVFFTSYYIGYMIGVFSVLYLAAVWFSRRNTFYAFLAKLARLLGAAALAAGCCAFLLLPAFLNLKNGQSELWAVDASPALEKPFVRIASRLLPGVYDTLTDPGYPNIYVTVLGLLLCVVYFCHRGVPRREKVVFGGLLVFMLFSFSCNLLDLAWHAFEDPTWFPARYSFVFCFLVLYLAMQAARRLDSLPVAAMAGAVLAVALLAVEVGIGRYRYAGVWSVAAAVGLAVLYGLLWFWGRRGRAALAAVALVLVCAEAWGNALVMEWGLDNQFQYKTRESYVAFREANAPAVEAVAAADPGVYRLELVEQRNANGGMALGYNGISHYSTTTDQDLNAFLTRLGYNRGTENELRYAANTPLTGGLLGIRYLLSPREMGAGYVHRGDVGGVSVYENQCAFPLAFGAGEAALETPSETGADPFALQNGLLRSLGRWDAFAPVPDVEIRLLNVDREERDGYVRYTPRVVGEPATVEYWLHNPGGRPVYAYFPVWNRQFAGGADILVDGVPLQRDLLYRHNAVAPCGSGETVVVALELGANAANIEAELFYTLDLEAAAAAARVAGERAMAFTRFADTAVRGTIAAPEGGVLVTTFPRDSGWRVRVDGQRTEPEAFAGVFLAVRLEPGEHEIAMTYRPPGFVAGCWISAICGIGIILRRVLRQYQSHITKNFIERRGRV